MNAASAPCPLTQGAEPPGAEGLPAAAIDPRVLAGLRQLDPDHDKQLMAKVLTTYRDSLARQLGQIVLACERQELPALQLAVHTLKSASASVGARGLAQLCAMAEALARSADGPALVPLVQQLRTEAGRVDAAVLQTLSALPSLPS